MESAKSVDVKDVEGQEPAKGAPQAKAPKRRLHWGFVAFIVVYTCFKASVRDWSYQKDLQNLHSHWAGQALGRHSLNKYVESTEKVEKMFL